jgi:hypothetical protein
MLKHILQERDKAGRGSITPEQLVEIFRIYEVTLDEGKAARLRDAEGNISKANFIQFSKVGGKARSGFSPRTRISWILTVCWGRWPSC